MRTVRDEHGRTYLLEKRSGSEWLVRDPETGQETYRPESALEPVEASPLEAVATAVSDPVRTVLTAVRTEQALGLLLEIDRDGPVAVTTLLDRYEYCESDLHGQLAEFRAAELIAEASVAGQRGYETTAVATDALATILDAD
ncbi:hypothetical protein Hrd1104_05895 [Halorhabdus sp. CBA1104]|uniref:DUF7346 family protein n=1 Tax=unclassified Halorhabdus TaxID=2621901 RepID=UPI0012B3EE6E|nr:MULTISPECIES: hypothetical protein [unclassified Halorhabdus]QGN06871.1 hypothetical protein Hrd1104_05895 [Halorhabdus sp. CBA1104]